MLTPMPKLMVRNTVLVLLGCAENERYAGSTGRVQGAKKVNMPAMNITKINRIIFSFGILGSLSHYLYLLVLFETTYFHA